MTFRILNFLKHTRIKLYDQWVDEVEADMMLVVMMIYLLAVFDMVDHPLLLKKLELFA